MSTLPVDAFCSRHILQMRSLYAVSSSDTSLLAGNT